MDPLSQGIIGATASQVLAQKQKTRVKQIGLVTLLGFLTGLSPDLDVLIKSDIDPLLFLEYHRHFTHSLFFIPIGGFLLAFVLHNVFGKLLFKKSWVLSFKESFIYATTAFATHGILDATTSYGTQLLWPLTDVRISWNNMSIIDPLYTLPIVFIVIAAAMSKKKWLAYLAGFWAMFYPTLGVIQRERAESVAYQLAESRGHSQPIDLSTKPSLGNIVLWKSVYEYDNRFYVDAIRVGFKNKIYPGDNIEKLPDADNMTSVYPWLDVNSQQAKDIERFRWFSQGYVSQDPNDPNKIMDMRYSAVPNQINALWSIELKPNAPIDEHVNYSENTDRSDSKLWETFFSMLRGD